MAQRQSSASRRHTQHHYGQAQRDAQAVTTQHNDNDNDNDNDKYNYGQNCSLVSSPVTVTWHFPSVSRGISRQCHVAFLSVCVRQE